jgi:fatty-acyl-CoA synthase
MEVDYFFFYIIILLMYLLKTMKNLFNETGLTWGTFLKELFSAIFLKKREGIAAIVRHHAEREPEKVAVICNNQKLTYAEIYLRALSFASSLYEMGLRQGDKIALFSQNALEIPEIWTGMNLLKLSSIPLNWHLKSGELNYILNDSECKSIIYQEHLRTEVVNCGVNLKNRIVIGKASEGEVPYDSLLSQKKPPVDFAYGDYPKTIVYTSGTTGKPKGAERTTATPFMIFVTTSVYEFGLKHSDVHLTVCPLYHSAPIVFMVLQLVLGATNVIMPKFNAEEMLSLIEKYKITSTFIVPYMVIELLSQPESVIKKYDLSSLKTVICAAAPLSPEHKRRFQKRFGNILYEFYGATETGINTILKPEDIPQKAESVGRVLPYNKIKILDEHKKSVPVNTEGEIYIKNPFLMNGYYKKDGDTKRSMHRGYLSVGDVGRIDADGFLYITDRKSDMVISGGVNIYPQEIENVLLNHPAVKYAAVIGVPDEKWGERLKAFIVKKEEMNTTIEELVLYLRDRIASFKVPKEWEFVDSLPITPSGKILKRTLRDKHWRDNKI